jgi:hypothetical protein
MDNVELEDAYTWRCPECKARNFSVPVPYEVREGDAERFLNEAKKEIMETSFEGYTEDQIDFKTYRKPRSVRCAKCKVRFSTGSISE